jgi:hypothetical protein
MYSDREILLAVSMDYDEYRGIATGLSRTVVGLGRETSGLRQLCESRKEWCDLINKHCPDLFVGWAETCMNVFRKSRSGRCVVAASRMETKKEDTEKVAQGIREGYVAYDEKKAQIEVTRLLFLASHLGFLLSAMRNDAWKANEKVDLRKFFQSALPNVSPRWALAIISVWERRALIESSYMAGGEDCRRPTTMQIPGVPMSLQVAIAGPFLRLVRIGKGSPTLTCYPLYRDEANWRALVKVFED